MTKTPKSITEEDVKKVRAALTAEEAPRCSDSDIRRFIRAESGNVQKGLKRLKATLAWRRINNPDRIVCTACVKDPRAHYLHWVGYDRKRRPTLYSCFDLAKDKTVEANRQHMIVTFEQAVKSMEPGVEKWVWFADFYGFGIADCNPGIARAFLDMTAKHYPERLGAFVIVDAPSVFNMLWRAILPFVDPVTKEKIVFLPNDVKSKKTSGHLLRTGLLKIFDEEMTEWLIHEMRENREKGRRISKVYSMVDIHDAVTAEEENSELARHWGTPEVMGRLRSQPELLHPQALHRTPSVAA